MRTLSSARIHTPGTTARRSRRWCKADLIDVESNEGPRGPSLANRPSTDASARRVAGSFIPVLLIAAMAVAIAGFYLATYVWHRFDVPLGWDSPGYAWRTNLARAVGIGNLPGSVPYPGPVNPGR